MEPFIQMYSLIKLLVLIIKAQGNILSGHNKQNYLHFWKITELLKI